MMWRTHFVIGAALPVLVGDYWGAVAAVVGSVAPDYLEQLPRSVGRKPIAHRTTTHVLLFWVLAVLAGFGLKTLAPVLFWWAWGGFTHVFADAFTPTGVPLTPTIKHRTNFFGGRIRTGGAAEYVIIGALVVIMTISNRQLSGAVDAPYLPFFPDWFGKYEDGLIDKYELKQNRFKWF